MPLSFFSSCLDFGVILGSRLYLKELTNRALIERDGSGNGHGPVFQEGDIVLKINSTSTEGMSLKEARKLMESCKDKLQLTVRRDPAAAGSTGSAMAAMAGHGAMAGGATANLTTPCHAAYGDNTYGGAKEAGAAAGMGPSHFSNYADNRPNYCNQNLYVQPPTRGGSVDYRNPLTPQPPLPPYAGGGEDKGNVSRLAGRSRGPLMDVSLSQLDAGQQQAHHSQPYPTLMNGHGPDEQDAPPRPPPPRGDDYYSPRGGRPSEPAEPVKPPPT